MLPIRPSAIERRKGPVVNVAAGETVEGTFSLPAAMWRLMAPSMAICLFLPRP